MLNDGDLLSHLKGKITIGVKFPQNYGRLIGLDIDTTQIHWV